MADLTGTTPADTYKGLLQVNDYTDGVDATAKYIQDGEGTDSALAISTDKVGIGTTSPDGKLTLSTSSENTGVAYGNLADSLLIENTSDDAGAGPKLVFYNKPDEGSGTPSALIGLMRETATDASTTGDNKGNLVFWTRGEVNPEQRMIIDSDGNVGIGTTDPNFKTSIVAGPEDTTPIALALSVDDTGLVAGQGVTLGFGQLDTVFSKIESFYQDSDGFGLKIYTGTKSTSTGTDRTKDEPSLTIDNNGNVGIGTTSPSHDLTLGSPTDTGTTSSRLKIYRGTDDPGQNLEMGYDHITVTRDANPLALDQSIFAIKQKGSDGERTVMHVDVAGNVGIGTTNPGYKLELKSLDDDWSARIVNSNNSGSGLVVNIASTSSSERIFSANSASFARFYVRADGTSFTGASTVTSDDRVKHNEQPIVGALETLGKITPKKYIKTADMYDANHDFELDADGNPIGENGESVEHRIEAGVIAQQVLTVDELAFAVSPEGVDEDGVVTSPHGLDYNSLFTYAIAAIQEQQQIINELKSQNELLAAQNVDFESRISKLEQQ